MEPYTATRLKERNSNTLKDFVAMSNPLGVTHILTLSSTEVGSYLRIIKVPRGPSLTFRILSYTLAKDFARLIKGVIPPKAKGFLFPPLLILSGFPDEPEYKLVSTMLQNMFPPLGVATMKLSQCRRVVVFQYDKETNSINFRHYFIRLAGVGVNKGVKKVLRVWEKRNSKVPNLSKLRDISDLILRDNDGSDSEREDLAEGRVNVEDERLRKFPQTAVRLIENGPRMELQLVKIEEGILEGKVMFHAFKKFTPEEIELRDKKREEQKLLKEKRIKEQEDNIKRKAIEKGEKPNLAKPNRFDYDHLEEFYQQLEKQEDNEWYKKEVGEEQKLLKEKKNQRTRRQY